MKMSFKKPRLPNHPVLTSNRYRDDDEDFGDDYIVLGLGVGILGVYWLAVHFLDKWTIDLLPWWVEPFTAIPLVCLLVCYLNFRILITFNKYSTMKCFILR